MNAARQQVAVVIGATSKWQADGRNTQLAHGKVLDDSALPVGIRWGVGGAIAQKFAQEGFVVVLTTRRPPMPRRWSRPSKRRVGPARLSSWTWCRTHPLPEHSRRFVKPWATRMS
jgi:NAD(P)-dependent dehydrogenase (short-subunit alcohol dehydrogenase family)